MLLSNEKLYLEGNSELIIPCVKSREFYSLTQMLVARKSKNLNVSLTQNSLKNRKIPFLRLASTDVMPPFIKISRLRLQKLLNS